MTHPVGSTTWRRATNQTIRWKLTQSVTAGAFRVWAVSAQGARYRVTSASKPVAAFGRDLVLGPLEGERAGRQGLPDQRGVLVGQREAGQRPEHRQPADQALAGADAAGSSIVSRSAPEVTSSLTGHTDVPKFA